MCDSYLGVQDIISCVLLRVPPSGGTLSVTHRRTYPLNPSPQLQRRLQHRSLAPRGSTDRNSGWCITGRRVSRLSQLNNRSSHARWKAHYSPVSGDSLLWCSFLNVVNCGKGEGTHFFSAVRGCAAVCKNQPLVPRSNFGGKVCARIDPWFCGQTLPVLGHGGGGYQWWMQDKSIVKLRLPCRTAAPGIRRAHPMSGNHSHCFSLREKRSAVHKHWRSGNHQRPQCHPPWRKSRNPDAGRPSMWAVPPTAHQPCRL